MVWHGIDIADLDIFEVAGVGPVWDLNSDTSLTHPNCRCSLVIEPEITEQTILRPIMALGEQTSLSQIRGTDLQSLRMNLRELNRDMGDLHWQILSLHMVIGRYTSVARRAGLPPEIDRALNTINRLQVLIWQTIYALRLLAAAQMGAGPIGWILAGSAALMAGMTVVDIGTEATAH